MSFNGSIIKSKSKGMGLSLTALASKLHVTRQAVNTWIEGRSPRGKHLVELCTLLDLRPTDFFPVGTKPILTVPLHRTVQRQKLTPQMTSASIEMAREYLNIFRQAPNVSMVSVARVQELNKDTANLTAQKLREISRIQDNKPMTYEGAFKLLAALNVFVVICPFPQAISKASYAFYSRIAEQRVVFVNIDINVIDLIFQLLHETVHAIRDEAVDSINTEAEELFCDKVAMFTQFPAYYTKMVETAISGTSNPAAIIKLKEFASENHHSVFGLYYRLREDGLFPDKLPIGGVAENHKKQFPTLREIIFQKSDPRSFVKMLFELSPHFMNLVKTNMNGTTVRKVGEWLGLDSTIDTKAVIDEIKLFDIPA
jgi:transcriptional regulator with XRE-family HTH domain